jgi:hypothetical protein
VCPREQACVQHYKVRERYQEPDAVKRFAVHLALHLLRALRVYPEQVPQNEHGDGTLSEVHDGDPDRKDSDEAQEHNNFLHLAGV